LLKGLLLLLGWGEGRGGSQQQAAGGRAQQSSLSLPASANTHTHKKRKPQKTAPPHPLTPQDRVYATPRVEVHLNTTVEDAFGNGVLQGLKTKDVATGSVDDLNVNGLFYGIGHTPNSGLVKGQVELDEAGYVKVRAPVWGWGGVGVGWGVDWSARVNDCVGQGGCVFVCMQLASRA